MEKVNPISNKVKEPSQEEIDKAVKVLDDYQLSIYQVLYEYGLTDANGHKMFTVENSIYNGRPTWGITIKVNGNKDYSFSVTTGEEALEKAIIVAEAIKTGKEKVSHRACCPLAEFVNCVCLEAFACPLHGSIYFGTHD